MTKKNYNLLAMALNTLGAQIESMYKKALK